MTFPSTNKRHWQPRLRILALLLSFTLLAGAVLITQAQDGDGEGDAPEPPPRNQDREAPERQPQIIEQPQNPDGTTSTVLVIPALADTYIASERPFQNFGSDALYLGYNLSGVENYGAQRILIQFDVENNIPDGAIIEDAMLELNLIFSSPTDDADMGTVLRRLASPWNEFSVTWNSEPTWTAIDDVTFVGSSPGWYTWDVTEQTAAWNAGTYPNYGLEIIGDEAVQQRERAFYARETNTGSYPRLTVTYTDINDNSPPDITVDALPAYSKRNFSVSWSGSDVGEAGIAYYDVQVRIDGGSWSTWLDNVTVTEADYPNGENGRLYEFRARGVDNAGNIEPFGDAEASTTVDTLPPTSAVDPLPIIINSDNFTVSWSGSDAGSGIQYYDVRYRFNGGNWVLWLPQTLATSANFTNAADGVYDFEARAADNLDQVEAFSNTAEASIVVDEDAPFITVQAYLPIVFKSD